MTRRRLLGAAVAASSILLAVPSAAVGSAPMQGTKGPQFSAAQRLGLQQVPKQVAAAGNAKNAFSSATQGVNPMIGFLPHADKSDYAYWRAALAAGGKKRAREMAARPNALAAEPLLVDEQEPANTRGSNDTRANAELIPQFGSAAGKRSAARVLGQLAPGPRPVPFARIPEDNGSIPLAGNIGLTGPGARSTTGTIGDGPHGLAADGKGDFDFYKLAGAKAGEHFDIDINTAPPSTLDSAVIVWDANGTPLALNDDDGQSLDSRLTFVIPTDGNYFVSVVGFPTFPGDPFDSGSGSGAGSQGAYSVIFGLNSSDTDFYSVNLRAGDVVGASVTGAATDMHLYGPKGGERVGSQQDASGIYPAASPLPGGGNAVLAYVADNAGPVSLSVTGGTGDYDITLEVYRPGPESLGKNVVPTLFLDFDGARVNTGIFGGPGVRQLSPFRAFLAHWGLPASLESAVINQIVSTVRENLASDFGAGGVRLRILNSRDNRDPFGQPNVSRVIVGGTIAESGIPTIGISQSIDPGNFAREETSLVLLDVLSDPASPGTGPDPSLNAYLKPQSNRVRFVGTAIGNVVAHEVGHTLGSFHVDQFDLRLNLMDQGGNFPLLYGVGPDGIGGTADDADVDFGKDLYNPSEGFTGTENTAAITKWGLSPQR